MDSRVEMMFRRAGEREVPSGRVIHGPFPARAGMIGGAAAALFLGVVFVLIALAKQQLHCGAEMESACTIDQSYAFTRAQIRAVRVDIERGSKNTKYGVVVVSLDSGSERRLMRVDPDDAAEAARAIEAARDAQAPIDVTLYGPRVLLPVGLASLVAFVVLTFVALSKMGRFDLVVVGPVLEVRRSLFGIPLTRTRVSLDGVERVVVDQGTLSPTFRSGNETLAVARLRLDTKTDQRPLSRARFPGRALHLRAAAALRAVLLLPPDPEDDEALAAIPMRTMGMGQRISFAWIGVTTGSLVGLGLFGTSLAVAGRTTLRANIEGWMLAGGAIPGAIAGAAIVFHATRSRLPR